MPDQAANQLTAEMLTHGEDIDSSIEAYERNYANYKEKVDLMNTLLKQWQLKSLEGGEQPRGKYYALLAYMVDNKYT